MEELTQTASSSVVPFGKYLLDEEIARGGMSRVYRARLRGLGGFEKKLVVKQVLPDLARDPRFVEMFVEEAKTLVQMSHPNIVPVYELGVVDGVYFLAMEHVEGATLAEMIKRGGSLAGPLVAHVAVQICDALAYAHERFGVVHRDVTPRNVIVDASGHARLLDFGIAAPVAGTGGTPGETFGSHGYMAREQLLGERLGPTSDLFSLGCVLYEALTGKPAFLKATVDETCAALLSGPTPTLSERPDVPPELASVVHDCLEPDPSRRPTSAQVLGRRLRGWLAATSPEGVAPELGLRAESARRAREAPRPRERPGDPARRRDPSGVVRTIATSRVLEDLLVRADAGDVAVDPTGATAPIGARPAAAEGTVPIPRASHPSIEPPRDAPLAQAPTEAGTVSIRNADATAPRPAAEPAPPRPRETSRVLLVAGVLIAAVAVALGVRALTASGAGTERTDPRAVAPRAPRPDPSAGRADPTHALTTPPDPGPTTAQGTSTSPGAPAPPVGPVGPPQTAPAFLAVNAQPWAEVRLGRRLLGTTPLRRVAIPPGNHVLELTCPPLGRTERVRIHATSGQVTPVFVNLSD